MMLAWAAEHEVQATDLVELAGEGLLPLARPSASTSQSRNRGHARVHDVHPFRPWVQSDGPSSSSMFSGLYTPLVSS